MNEKQKNFKTAMHPSGSLRDSVDSLRTSIRDLYELDEDNYQKIKLLNENLDKVSRRIDAVQRTEKRHHGRTVLGFVGVVGFCYLVGKGLDMLDKRLNAVEGKADKAEDEEESDG